MTFGCSSDSLSSWTSRSAKLKHSGRILLTATGRLSNWPLVEKQWKYNVVLFLQYFTNQTSWIIVYWLFRLTCRRWCPRHHDPRPLLDGKLCCPLWQYLSLPLINQTHHFNNENSLNYYPSVEQAPTKTVNVILIPNSLPPSSYSLAELPSSDTDRLEWLEARGVTLGLLWSEHSERVRATSR